MTTVAQPVILKDAAAEEKQESQIRVIWRRFRRHRLAMISLILISVVFISSLLAPVIAPFERDAIDLSSNIRPAPGWR